MNIKNYLIKEEKTLREALQLIDKNNSGTIFIIDKNDIVVGVATDGDIRRKLLDGIQLDDKINAVVSIKPISPMNIAKIPCTNDYQCYQRRTTLLGHIAYRC